MFGITLASVLLHCWCDYAYVRAKLLTVRHYGLRPSLPLLFVSLFSWATCMRLHAAVLVICCFSPTKMFTTSLGSSKGSSNALQTQHRPRRCSPARFSERQAQRRCMFAIGYLRIGAPCVSPAIRISSLLVLVRMVGLVGSIPAERERVRLLR